MLSIGVIIQVYIHVGGVLLWPLLSMRRQSRQRPLTWKRENAADSKFTRVQGAENIYLPYELFITIIRVVTKTSNQDVSVNYMHES